MLVATTYGSGDYAIRLERPGHRAGRQRPLYTYAVNPVDGPHVVDITASPDVGNEPSTEFTVTFSGPVDPATFTAAKVNGVTDLFGNPVPVASIIDDWERDQLNVYEILPATPQTADGFYHVDLGPAISDYCRLPDGPRTRTSSTARTPATPSGVAGCSSRSRTACRC